MPLISKGGKYIFGWTRIKGNGEIIIPNEIVEEYHLRNDQNLILITGSGTSGGFCVSSRSMLIKSTMSELLSTNQGLADYSIPEQSPVKFKGRSYLWARYHENNTLVLNDETLEFFKINKSDLLLTIRGSDIASVFAAKGPIVEKAKLNQEIQIFE